MVHVSLCNPGMCENAMILLLLFWSTIVSELFCPSDQLPPPTDLEVKWLTSFTVNLSWKEPRGLSDNIKYKYMLTTPKTPKWKVSVIGFRGPFEGQLVPAISMENELHFRLQLLLVAQ